MKAWELHPALVHFPIALLLSATALEAAAVLRKRERLGPAAYALLLAGVLSALPAAAAGLIAYFTLPGHSEGAHRRMLIHPALAGGAVLLYAIVAALRRNRRAEVPRAGHLVISLLAAGLLIATATLGGHLVYRDGLGVQPRAGEGHGHTHTHERTGAE